MSVVAGSAENSTFVFLSDTHSAVRYTGLGSEVRVKSWESRLRDRQGTYCIIYYSHEMKIIGLDAVLSGSCARIKVPNLRGQSDILSMNGLTSIQ